MTPIVPFVALLAVSGIVPQPAGGVTGLRFGHPVMLPPGHGPWFDSIRSFGRQAALGSSDGGFLGTTNGGKTWTTPPLAPAQAPDTGKGGTQDGWQNDTRFTITSPDGRSMHNMGDIVGVVAAANARRRNVTGTVTANTTTTFSFANGRFSAALTPKTISFAGIPSPGITAFRTGGADWLRLTDGTIVAAIIVTWADVGRRASITSFISKDDGFYWTYAGDIARANKVESNEGPNENALTQLANGTVLCYMRLDAGDAGRYHRYAASSSHDHGHTWSTPVMNDYGLGAARPRFLVVGSSLLLSGGRTWQKNRDTFVWLNPSGDAAKWVPYSVSYWHNLYVTNVSEQFTPDGTNNSDHWPRESNSYTSLLWTSPISALVAYELKGQFGFVMPINLV